MKAFILAAGLGTRLGELTKEIPKALVKINGEELLGILINHLKGNGYKEFLINVHHHAQMVINYLNKNNNFGVQIHISDERDELLDTGGAVLKASDYFTGKAPVLIHNVDIISEVDYPKLLNYHLKNQALASLCVRKRNSDRALLFNDNMELKGWMKKKTNEYKWVGSPLTNYSSFAFSGIYLVNPEFINKIKLTGNFSIIDAWLSIAGSNKIRAYLDSSENWFDLGTMEKIKLAESYLKNRII